MADVPRKKIEELVALYELEPTVRDVYVEGPSDVGFFRWCFAELNIVSPNIVDVDVVEIPTDIISDNDLNAGCKRSRRVVLSRVLASRISSDCRIVCIVDRDFDDYLGRKEENRFLLITDFTSVDMYFFQRRLLRKFIDLVLGGFPLTEDEIINALVPLLREIFLIRLTNVILDWKMEWIDIRKYIHVATTLSFDSSSFVHAYLNKNNRLKDLVEFGRKKDELKRKVVGDDRCCIRGHDYIEVLHYLIRKKKRSRYFGDLALLQGAFRGCVEYSDIRGYFLFRRLEEIFLVRHSS